jgi:PIN domain nuclease of toxin-antitoxin system
MRYLLDTHTFLWASSEQKFKLGKFGKGIIENECSELFVSAVSGFEITNKFRIGKLDQFDDIANNYKDCVFELDARHCQITAEIATFAGEFEWEHRDPFDRILAATAKIEDLTLITNDKVFQTLPWVKTVW